MDYAQLKPTPAELQDIIERFKVIRAKWDGNKGYARQMDVEIWALHVALFMLTHDPDNMPPVEKQETKTCPASP